MEAILGKHVIPSIHANLPMKWHITTGTSEELKGIPLLPRRVKKLTGGFHIIPCSKRSSFQDFQDFAKPLRVLPAMEAEIYTRYVSEEMISSVKLDESNSFYIIKLQTSKDFGSGLKDMNAAVQLCLIDASGNSILQRISAVSREHPELKKEIDFADTIHFQRGSVDIITFMAPKLGKIEALWIGLESGSWRLDGVGLTVIHGPLSLSGFTNSKEDGKFDGFQYKFEANNILLGEEGLSVAELRPVLVTEFHSDNISTILNSMNHSLPTSDLDRDGLSNEESMREYADLKFSLLLYDFILVITGSTVVLAFSSSERDAYAFLAGGIGGFLYLLLLQRSVDGLSTDVEIKNFVQGFGRFKEPSIILAFIVATSIAAMKYGTGSSSTALTPAELVLGVAGFLACKVAVVLAAFKPIKISSRENE